jgi:hypothetical protein
VTPHSETVLRGGMDTRMHAIVTDLTTPRSDSGTHAAVQKYLDKGWVVLPVPRGTRDTRERGWQEPSKRWEVTDFRRDDNIALRLDDITDVEPDHPLARQICRALLPATACYGRPSSPGIPTHYLYYLDGTPEEIAKLKTFTLDGKEMIGIRSGRGEYSLLPPSHYFAEPDRGKSADTLAWISTHQTPLRVSVVDMLPRVRLSATIAALASKWEAGGRHKMAGYAAGLLCRLFPRDDEQWSWVIFEHENRWEKAIEHVIEQAAKLANDPDVRDRVTYARNTVARFKQGQAVKGGPSLRALVGDDLVSQMYRWWDDSGQTSLIDEMNEKHAVLFGQHGKIVVITEEVEDGQPQLRFSDPGTMGLLYPRTITVGKSKTMTVGEWWVRHPQRRFYRGIELAPNDTGNPGYYNLWRGFAVEPRKGDWSLFRDHLRLVVGDNEDHARYLEAWMAETVQHPERPIGIVPTFKGEQGTGKSTLGKWFGALFGPHFIHLDSEQRLLGNFNAHLHNKIVVLADEAVWAGSKAGLGALKRMITEDTLNIERKHVDVIEVKNLLHMIVASNEDWVVPVGFDNRRFAVFNVGTRHKNDRKYFAAIRKQLFEQGGLAALLYDLLEYRSDIDLWDIPETTALTEQKVLSAKPIHRWWIEKLHTGQLVFDKDDWSKVIHVPKDMLHSDYMQFVHAYTTNRWEPKQTQTQLGMFLASETPVYVNKNSKDYIVPSLDECRAHWIKRQKWAADYEWEPRGSGGSREGSELF